MTLICEAALRLPLFGVSLGEFVVEERLAAVAGEGFHISLKFCEYIGPDTLGLSGREFVIPLQSLTELFDKKIRESPANGASRVFTHSLPPGSVCGEAEPE
jgi:hypothetical protein